MGGSELTLSGCGSNHTSPRLGFRFTQMNTQMFNNFNFMALRERNFFFDVSSLGQEGLGITIPRDVELFKCSRVFTGYIGYNPAT